MRIAVCVQCFKWSTKLIGDKIVVHSDLCSVRHDWYGIVCPGILQFPGCRTLQMQGQLITEVKRRVEIESVACPIISCSIVSVVVHVESKAVGLAFGHFQSRFCRSGS